MNPICFATRNQHKIQEISAQLGDNFKIISLDAIGCTEELPETTGTIEGNSKQKAQYIWENYQTNCFADDSGLEVAALKGAPGVDSAHYAGTRDFQANITLLLKNLAGQTQRNAQFKTVITLVHEGVYHQFTGIIKGQILQAAQGTEGFGYDPIFRPEGYQQTFAQMPSEEKNKISHRALAFKQLKEFLIHSL